MPVTSEFRDYVEGKRVAIVGPSPSYAGMGKGADIDAYDLVVRMNWGPWDRSHADLGSRTDILYRRLLTGGMPDESEVARWVADGVQWVVTEGVLTKHHDVEKLLAGRIPMANAGNIRAKLIRDMKTHPLLGPIALTHLLDAGAESVTLLNQPYEHVGYVNGYGGQGYRDSKGDRRNNRIAPMHDVDKHIAWIDRAMMRDKRIKVDDMLAERLMRPNAKAVVCIPARLGSSRFPNKPLAKIAGKEMILHVIERALPAGFPVYVCTPDMELATFVRAHGYQAVVTDETITGTDCVALAMRQVRPRMKTVVVSIQGDEPLLDYRDIWALVRAKAGARDVVNGYSPIGEDAESRSVVKAAVLANGRIVYASRAPIPATKDGHAAKWKQLGMYAFTGRQLHRFVEHGKKGTLEAHEDVEILRFLDFGMGIQGVQLTGTPVAVDHPEDVERVEAIMRGEG